MNHIYIEPVGGLANRMRVIASVLQLKKQYNFEVFCIWNENSELNAKFDELFEDVIDLNIITKSKNMKRLKPTNHKNFIYRIFLKIRNKLLGFNNYIVEKDVAELVKKDKLYDIIKNNKGSIYIRSYMIDYEWDNKHLNSIFQPVKTISKKVDAINFLFSKYSEVIGLHIRRSDNIIAIKNSPIELFINEIEKKQKDNVGFFLATDDKDIEYLLLKLYPNKIIIAEQKTLERNSLQGIQSAIIDMFSLSKTTIIYGSYWSSFSTISGKIGNIECIRLEKKL